MSSDLSSTQRADQDLRFRPVTVVPYFNAIQPVRNQKSLGPLQRIEMSSGFGSLGLDKVRSAGFVVVKVPRVTPRPRNDHRNGLLRRTGTDGHGSWRRADARSAGDRLPDALELRNISSPRLLPAQINARRKA